MGHRFHPSVLREYDIRGIVGQTIGPADATAIGRGFARTARRGGGTRVAVGYDGRLSSPLLEAALIEGLVTGGVDVVRIGLGPSPMLYYAEAVLEVDAAIQVTGSHNPSDHNGFKLVLRNRPFFGEDIRTLARLAESEETGEARGGIANADILSDYVDRLMMGYAGGAFRMGWDAGNGAAGPIVEQLVARLPGEHHALYTAVDGAFPHHHPDPTEDANLADLRALVLEKRLDFGVAFDGDGDRIVAIDDEGVIVRPDQLLAILAEPVLRALSGATVIGDVKASRALFQRIADLGGVPLMWKSGHSWMKAKMIETGAPIAGEMSGHVFFGHDYYGFDDALYAAVRLIAAVRQLGRPLSALRRALPASVSTPELRLAVPEERKFAVVEEVLARLEADGARIDRTDGARVETPDGWWLLRASNTQAMLTVRAEAADAAGLSGLLDALDTQLAESGIAPVVR